MKDCKVGRVGVLGRTAGPIKVLPSMKLFCCGVALPLPRIPDTTTLENILENSRNKSEMQILCGLLYYLICQAKSTRSHYANVFNI